ncbi:MAG: Ig-like domain-containing protein [Longimicrobiaceae bacterium]
MHMFPLLLVALLAVLAGCEQPSAAEPPGAPGRLAAGARPAAAEVATQVAQALVVRLTDARGHGVPGVAVDWRAAPGSGTVAPQRAVTDDAGRASTRWTLGTRAGEQAVSAAALTTAGPAEVAFAVAARAGAPTEVRLDPAEAAMEPGGTRRLAWTAVDRFGNEVGGRKAAWSSGSPAVASVDAEGVVTGRGLGTTTVTAVGDGFTRTARITVVASLAVLSVSAGDFHSCAVTGEQRAYCWGRNDSGQLGDGSTASRTLPSPVAGGLRFAAVSAQGGFHSCGLTPEGRAYCWGGNAAGQLGDGTTVARSAPVAVAGGHTFASVSVNANHSCGLTREGRALCWGSNEMGQLGTGSLAPSPVPVPVSGGLLFTALDAGGNSTCGIAAGGQLFCWGWNYYAQLGDGSFTNQAAPTRAAGGLRFASVDAGSHLTCGVATDGAGYCWGYGYGSGRDPGTPTRMGWSTAFRAVLAGGYSACGLGTDGAAQCWYEGQTAGGAVPGIVFESLSAGTHHVCGVTSAYRAVCWGRNEDGQLGDGTRVPRPAPTPVRLPG